MVKSQSETPSVPQDPRFCSDCQQTYWLLTPNCSHCGSDDTEFVDENTLEPTDGFGNLIDS